MKKLLLLIKKLLLLVELIYVGEDGIQINIGLLLNILIIKTIRFFYRLIDLSDENVTELKLPEQINEESEQEATKEEAAVDTLEEMAQNATNGNIVSTTYFSLIIN
jgi:hypothetical protein